MILSSSVTLIQSLIKFLDSTSNYQEPKINQKCDRQGNIYWQIYDPVTRQYASFASEKEVRIWLEKRYYH